MFDSNAKKKISNVIGYFLDELDSYVDKAGTKDTPFRVAKMYDELLSGYTTNINKLLNNALFDVQYDEMVVVKNIDFYSLCEHHMIPFYGTVSVGYLPKDKVIGLSKIPRLVDMFSKRLQVQERMTQEIAHAINDLISPKGVGVVVEGKHLCASMRGVKKPNVMMSTSALLGVIKEDHSSREEFLDHIK
ncbi:MAG: GTP cyclohydrolase I FolE [Dehalococcoidia bacterium]|nr:GTP cyclohydrolase I FolE [Dehalococcoidia bacterium]MQG09344.1 GTP cyclohydrolase I FolE [SAR202 cluster bacterium]